MLCPVSNGKMIITLTEKTSIPFSLPKINVLQMCSQCLSNNRRVSIVFVGPTLSQQLIGLTHSMLDEALAVI